MVVGLILDEYGPGKICSRMPLEGGGAKLGDKMVLCLACNFENAGELVRENTVI